MSLVDLKQLYSWALSATPFGAELENPNMAGINDMTTSEYSYLDELEAIAKTDVEELRRKEKTYQGSWKKRGGTGAFMMLARKWDRIETISEQDRYDIFSIIDHEGLDGKDGELIAEVRDLRRYLMLVEAYLTSISK